MRIGIIGALGKMGKQVTFLAQQDPEIEIAWGLVKQKDTAWQHIPLYTHQDTLPPVDILIDFSTKEAFSLTLALAIRKKIPLVLGTTGLSQEEHVSLLQAGKQIPLFWSPNFSVGIAIMVHLAKILSSFTSSFDCHMTETHHAHKKDAPSGSALAIRQALKNTHIPIQSIRIGEVVGEHTLYLETKEEKITLSHQSLSRDVFAKGALQAAKFLQTQPPKLYGMEDLLPFHFSS